MKIDSERRNRYQDKLDFILERIEDLPPYNDETSEYRRYFIESLYYRVQTAIEATMDIIAMLCKDNNLRVEDDYNNIEKLIERKILPQGLGGDLRKLNGLRNVLVHRYNKIEEKLILEKIDEIIGVITTFVEFTAALLE